MKNVLKITAIGILSFLICINKSYAQIDTSTTQKLFQYIMQPLDKSQIPTGFLEEYGCPMLPMVTFNGTLTKRMAEKILERLWQENKINWLIK